MNEKVPNSWSKFWRQKMVRTLLFFNRRCQNMASNLKPFLASKTLPVCVTFVWNGQAFCVFRAIEGSEPAWCPSLAVSCFFFWPRAGPAQPQPQNCKASLLYLTSGGVGFTGMEVRTDVVGTGEAHELVCEIWWCLWIQIRLRSMELWRGVVFMCGVQRKAKASVWVPTCGDELLGECDVEVVVEVCGMSETRRLEKVIFFILFLEVAPPLPPRLLTHEHAQTSMLKRWRSWLPVLYNSIYLKQGGGVFRLGKQAEEISNSSVACSCLRKVHSCPYAIFVLFLVKTCGGGAEEWCRTLYF